MNCYSQSSSKKNARKADLKTAEKAEAVKDLAIAKLKIDRNRPKPDWAPKMNDEMLAVIEKLQSYKSPGISTLSASEARKLPSPANAVLDLIKDNNINILSSKTDTSGKNIPVKNGNIHLRFYTPKEGNGPFPLIVYYPGGGWVISDLDTYHSSAKVLAEQTGSVVVSVGYRKAPEHKFPVAHQDAFAAYEWVLKNADSIKGDWEKIAVAGESAGGNLAVSVCMMARENKIRMPVHQLLIYPVASKNMNSESYNRYAAAEPLNKPMMEWFFKQYLKDTADASHRYINLVASDLKGLPPATVITAELDPLQSDGELLATNLNASAVRVYYKKYSGVTHEFFGMGSVVPTAMIAEMFAAKELKQAFKGFKTEK